MAYDQQMLAHALNGMEELYGTINICKAVFVVDGGIHFLDQVVQQLRGLDYPAAMALSEAQLMEACLDDRYRLCVLTPGLFVESYARVAEQVPGINMVICLGIKEHAIIYHTWQSGCGVAVSDVAADTVKHLVSLQPLA